MVASVVGVLLFAVLASGCYSAATSVVVNNDGSGTMAFRVAVDTAAVAALAEQAGGDTPVPSRDELCAQFDTELSKRGMDNLPTFVTAETFDDGASCGVTLAIEVGPGEDPGAAFSAILAMAGSADPTMTPPAIDLTLVGNDVGGWDFRYEGATDPTVLMGGAGSPVADAAATDSVVADYLASSATITYELVLPGQAVPEADNATTIEADGDATRFVWDLEPGAGSDELVASTEGVLTMAEATMAENAGGDGNDSAGATTVEPSGGVDAGAGAVNDSSAATIVDGEPQPDELAYEADDGGTSGLLLGLAAMMAVLGIGGWFMISRSRPSTVD